MFWIYTEKFGMIVASAKSVRLEKSKLRNNLSVFSCGEFAVISSKDFWKITDAREVVSFKSLDKIKVFSKIAGLAVRMIKGEERNDKTWLELKNAFLTEENEKDFEIKSVARLLKSLGHLDKVPENRNELLSSVNRAIKESML